MKILAFILTLTLLFGSVAIAQDREATVEYGKYLVETIAGCGNCHTPHNPDGSLDVDLSYSGAFVIDEPTFLGVAPNITPDRETGIGDWSEDDIVRAIREGVRPDGRVLSPPMSFAWYRRLADTEAYAIAAFLKTVPAISNEVEPSEIRFPLESWGPPVGNVPDVPRDDPVAYGEYLAGPVGHCMDCHTPFVEGVQDLTQIGRGGTVFEDFAIFDWAIMTANITSDPRFGIGNWSDEEIKRAITDGVSRNGRVLRPIMPFTLYKEMTDEDLDALVAYLRSLPPLGAPLAAEEN